MDEGPAQVVRGLWSDVGVDELGLGGLAAVLQPAQRGLVVVGAWARQGFGEEGDGGVRRAWRIEERAVAASAPTTPPPTGRPSAPG